MNPDAMSIAAAARPLFCIPGRVATAPIPPSSDGLPVNGSGALHDPDMAHDDSIDSNHDMPVIFRDPLQIKRWIIFTRVGAKGLIAYLVNLTALDA